MTERSMSQSKTKGRQLASFDPSTLTSGTCEDSGRHLLGQCYPVGASLPGLLACGMETTP